MVVGNGMLAKAFIKYQTMDNIVILASGVSNSRETKQSEFDREELLIKTIAKKNLDNTIIYFSTCSIEDKTLLDSYYVLHKKRMESIIKKHNKYYIFRLPQVVGNTNSPTLINFLFTQISLQARIDVYKNATRNIISIDDVYFIVNYLVENNIYMNEITNIATPFNSSVIDIVSKIEELLNIKADYNEINSGEKQIVNIDKILSITKEYNLFNENYIHILLNKYYSNLQLMRN
jgi:nucleoside-diphosphate-sugar epimerase